MNDVLKRPVHIAILKPTQLEKMAAQGKIDQTPFGLNPNVERIPLPEEKEVKVKYGVPKVAGSDLVKKIKRQIKLKVLHAQVKPLAADRQPNCGACKTAACCRAFVVNITELEYESGLYGDSAVKITPEISKQLGSKFLRIPMAGAPAANAEPTFFLEGKMGEVCPFLQDDNRCGIYDIRPFTCRTYSCVDDQRITQEMKDGTVSMRPSVYKKE